MIEVYYAEDDETIGKSVKEYLEQQNCKVAVFDRIADVKKALIGHCLQSSCWTGICRTDTVVLCVGGFGRTEKICR